MLDNCPDCATWIQCYQDAAKEADRLRARLARVEAFLSEDSVAWTYQTMGQYRTAAIAAIRAGEDHGTRP